MQNEWIIDLESKFEKLSSSEAAAAKQDRNCIFRVSKMLRQLNPDAYTPQIVSFGPYHHGVDHLKRMEELKPVALFNYLKRAEKTLAQVAEAMSAEVQSYMEFYEGLEKPWTDENRFLELMIIDGCFFLDLMIWNSVKMRPHYRNHSLLDVWKLENQLPMPVLAKLMELGGHQSEDTEAYMNIYGSKLKAQHKSITELGCHHLHLRIADMTYKGSYYYDEETTVLPATELVQAGIHFKPSGSYSWKDISFSNGVLKLPAIEFSGSTEAIFFNYLAFEEIYGMELGVTSLAFIMDDLVNTAKDVELLRRAGIITGFIGSDLELASSINRITKEIYSPDPRDDEENNVNLKLQEYCNKTRHKLRAGFIQAYLANPWVFISVLGAIILLLLTITQAVYTIMPFYKKF